MSRNPQIFWPSDMREDITDRREFSHWLEAVEDIDAEKKRNTKQKDNSMNEYNEYDKLEYIHSTIQEAMNGNPDKAMLETSICFVEDIREKHPEAPWNTNQKATQ